VRILITVKPQMYRAAIAVSIYRYRPDAEIMLVSPEYLTQELRSFRPHLLVRNDTDEVTPDALVGVAHQVEVLYTDDLDAKVILDGRARTVQDMSMDDLFRVIDEAEELILPQETAG
jgi:hypothetical protein